MMPDGESPEERLRSAGGKSSTYRSGTKPPPGGKSEPAPGTAAPLRVTLFREVEAAIEVNDFVEGLLIATGMSVVFGEPNSGKTFMVLDLAFHVARGATWFGREVDAGGVLYVALEGGIGIRNRIAAYRQANGLEDTEIQFALVTQPVSLLEREGVASLISTIEEIGRQFEAPLKLVIIDTASRALAGGDENSSVDMGCLIANADTIRARTGVHINFIHHSGKDAGRGARGWSGLRGAIDTEIEVTEDNGKRTIHTRKQRDLEKGPPFGFTLEQVELGTDRRGKPVRSCIVRPADPSTASPADPARDLAGHNRRAYEVLQNRIIDEGNSGFAGTPPGILSVPEQSWRKAFYSGAMPGASQDAKQKAFARASKDLMDKRLVAMDASRVWITSREQPGQTDRT